MGAVIDQPGRLLRAGRQDDRLCRQAVPLAHAGPGHAAVGHLERLDSHPAQDVGTSSIGIRSAWQPLEPINGAVHPWPKRLEPVRVPAAVQVRRELGEDVQAPPLAPITAAKSARAIPCASVTCSSDQDSLRPEESWQSETPAVGKSRTPMPAPATSSRSASPTCASPSSDGTCRGRVAQAQYGGPPPYPDALGD